MLSVNGKEHSVHGALWMNGSSTKQPGHEVVTGLVSCAMTLKYDHGGESITERPQGLWDLLDLWGLLDHLDEDRRHRERLFSPLR